MNDSKYKYTLYLIVVVILSTIAIQAYWNYKNYLSSKQQLINDVQGSLDKAVDDYYAELAKKTTIGFKFDGDAQKDVFKEGGVLENITKSIDESGNTFTNLDNIDTKNIKGISVFRGIQVDSMEKADQKKDKKPLTPEEFKSKIGLLKANNNLKSDISRFGMLTSKVVISISNDTLNLKEVDSLFQKELFDKKISVNYNLNYIKKENESSLKTKNQDIKNETSAFLSYTSKSTFLPTKSTLSVKYKDETWSVLKRVIWALIISTLLILGVVSCLFYLLKIIKNQKQLAEVKNDLISNITHEFKTPIATIGVALESISNFNIIDNKEKTKEYINMSSNQLSKLNIMVEKLLETATLDSESLELNKEEVNMFELLESLVNRYKIQHPEKNFETHFESENTSINVDIFHFENALNNIIDNAVKYGGKKISVDLFSKNNMIGISISDNGNILNKDNKNRIFEKFYRIPKGNTHDVKGFGIGLYYTKSIVQKHNGSIELDLNNKLTTFKILLPNGSS